MGKEEDMDTWVEVGTLVEAVIQDTAEATRGNDATTVGKWDIYSACVGNREAEPKDRDHRETVEEEAAVGLTHHFLA